ncbi:MAG: radical SAM protein [Nitrospira sp. CR1.2]|nr:radical SAM protein [Nitrospira sp. CR1.2]
MKVLLIPPTYRYTTQYPSFLAASDFSCGFAYIAAALKAAGHRVFGCNPNNAPGYDSAFDMIHDKIARAIAETKPDLIGVGGICTDYPFLQDAVSIIRHYAPTVPLLMGGSIITYDQEFIHSALKPDYSLAGEADETVVMLLHALEGRGDLNAIPNLCYRKNGGLVFTEKNLKFGGDLNAQPFPDYSIFDIEKMLESSWGARPLFRYSRSTPRLMPIVTARECPFACTFCLHGHGGRAKYRARTTENVMEEIKHLYESYSFNILMILDELFAVNKQKLDEFCRTLIQYRERYGWDFDWQFQTHANARLNREALQLAKQAGCTYFSYGMESASQRVLKSMKKGTQPEQYAEAIELADQVEIGFGGNFIFGDPAETPETISETLTFYRKYCADIHCYLAAIQPYPGSTLYVTCREKGLIPDQETFYKTIDQKLFNMTAMTDAQWAGYVRAILAFEALPLCRTVDVSRIVIRAISNPMTLDGTRQFWELFAECPHCSRSFSYVELTEPKRVPVQGLQVVAGCARCSKRVRLNVPVTKEQGVMVPVESEAAATGTPAALQAPDLGVKGSGEAEIRRNVEAEVRAFMERVVALCEQGDYHKAVTYYESGRPQLLPDPALVEFDQMVGRLRQKLAA